MNRIPPSLLVLALLLFGSQVLTAQEVKTDSTLSRSAQTQSDVEETSVLSVGPGLISFQGIAKFGGVPYSGSLQIKFRIFKVVTGGSVIWSETQIADVDDGLFSVELGSVNPLSIPFDKPYWLQMKLSSDPWIPTRVKLLEAPYAFTAAALQGKPVSTDAPAAGDVLSWDGSMWDPTPQTGGGGSLWTLSSGHIYRATGSVAIGTIGFKGKLHVKSNSTIGSPQIYLNESGNDYARLNFTNSNGSNYWSIAGYTTAGNPASDRLNIWNGATGDLLTITGDGQMGLGVGISPKTDFHVGNGRSVLFGTDTLGSGDKLMWLPDRHAFRVGTVATGAASTYWNADSIGLYSFASGLNTRAQGFGATAMGRDTEATNSYAFASGFFTNADGQYSTAMGFNTDATALGSTALGYSTDAEQNYSFAAGYFAEAQAIYSVAIGNAARAQSYSSMAVGRYNVGGGSATSWLTSDPIFEIGIGSGPSARANAVTVRKNGNVGIGTTVPLDKLHVNGRIRLGTVETFEDGGTSEIAVRGDLRPTANNVYDLGTSTLRWDDVYATNGVINTSDRRLKRNIQTVPSGLDKVMQLRPVSFNWIRGPDSGLQFGLVAQEVMLVIPEAVKTTDFQVDEETEEPIEVAVETLGVNYSRIIPFLIKAIQDQQAIIETLTNRVETLEGN